MTATIRPAVSSFAACPTSAENACADQFWPVAAAGIGHPLTEAVFRCLRVMVAAPAERWRCTQTFEVLQGCAAPPFRSTSGCCPASKCKNIAFQHGFRDTRRPYEKAPSPQRKPWLTTRRRAPHRKKNQYSGTNHESNGYHSRIRRCIAACA